MKVVLGLSGGVDSSVSAYLLKKQGYDVVAVNFSLTGEFPDGDCRLIADKLGIPLVRLNFSELFSDEVFAPFIAEYRSGRTPNLCVRCNERIKFGALYGWAKQNGADFMATGHYVKKITVGDKCLIAKPADSKKDQTYFLNQVNPEVLRSVLFPLAEFTKEQVRNIAAEQGLVTAHKKGSSDICLMGDKSFREFISPYIAENKGLIRTAEGKIVGSHSGLFGFTLGQRKGLGIGGKSGESGRWFVTGKNLETNELIVSCGSQETLFSSSLKANSLNFFTDTGSEFECFVKTRYRDTATKAKVKIENGIAYVEFFEKQRAVTPGQYCVFYDGDILLGGGVIL